ncbi:hypothetical protein I4U23_010681 [Adineta vaga]|nr:hypothetical protein I4U23_010681 [Adineta vaga]
MSSTLLTQIQLELIRIGLPICIIIANVSSILGLFVFLQKTMRNNPCVIYFIVYMITNLIYIDFTAVSTVFSGYAMDFSIKSNLCCSIRMYLSYVFTAIPSYLLVMTSLDRMFISSSNVHIRQRSSKRFSLLIIIIIIIFWLLFHLHAFFFSEVQLIYGIRLSCTTRSGIPSSFISYYGLINAMIPITLMSLFGIQTLKNIHKIHRNRSQSLDKRLTIILIGQISIYICLRLPLSLYLIYSEITKYRIKSSNQILIEQFIYFITIFCQFIQVSLSPLINLSTKSFRNELKRILYQIIGKTYETNGSLVLTRNVNTIQMKEIIPRQNNTYQKINKLSVENI